ncbi:MAG TPA: hypothetical protein VFU35_12895, partial [Jatrophihabitans sp.]|nr:hypothetical protein [Jatrophihabitans sp.]
MTTRAKYWIVSLAVVDALAFALTIHAHLTWRRQPGGPTVMPLGQLLGWIISVGLLLILILVVLESRPP